MKDYISLSRVGGEGWYAKAFKWRNVVGYYLLVETRGPFKDKPSKQVVAKMQESCNLGECEVIVA